MILTTSQLKNICPVEGVCQLLFDHLRKMSKLAVHQKAKNLELILIEVFQTETKIYV